MSTVVQQEVLRRAEQTRLDLLKSARERNRWGQFATPPALSAEIASVVWSMVKDKDRVFRFLDPAIGTGSFYAAFLRTFPSCHVESALGIELDEAFAEAAISLWKPHGLEVLQGDFTKQEPKGKCNVVLTNPPYVRHHHLAGEDKRRLGELAYSITRIKLSGLAGLYCYFLLLAHAWLAEGGIAAWLIPSEFMDVNYGEGVKRYLLERVSLRRIHRFCPSEVQFDDALVSSAVVIFENAAPGPEHEVVFSFGGSLSRPTRIQAVGASELAVSPKWSAYPREPTNGRPSKRIVLGDLFTVKRGLATGANSFFIIKRSRLQSLGIPTCCVRPILPSPRFLRQQKIEADEEGWPLLDEPLALIDCSLSEEEIGERFPGLAAYLRRGRGEGVHGGYLASRRSPWYSQEKRRPAPLLCTYMGRSRQRPFRFIRNESDAVAANVYLLLYPKDSVSRQLERDPALWETVLEALRGIHPESLLGEGRVYGGGLHKLEPAELMRVPAEGLARLLGVECDAQPTLF